MVGALASTGGRLRPSPPTSTPPPSPWPSPSPGIVAPPSPSPGIGAPPAPSPGTVTPPPAHVLYVGRDFVRRGCQTAHWHGRCRARNEDRAKKGHQSDESYSDLFHGSSSVCSPNARSSTKVPSAVRMGTVVFLCGPERHLGPLRAYRPCPLFGPCEGSAGWPRGEP